MLNPNIIEPAAKASACIIWMHGLGADAEDMRGLARELAVPSPIRHVCLNADKRPITINQGMAMRAWYDILGFELAAREDSAGILASQAMIEQVIQAQLQDGLAPQQIYLAGFSQGGAMALWTALQTPRTLGGVIALSAYLPLAQSCQFLLAQTTPMFIGYGTRDTIVKPEWTQQSIQWLRQRGFLELAVHAYPMEHTICNEELQALRHWLQTTIPLHTQDKNVGEN